MLRAGALHTSPGRTLEDMGKTGPSGSGRAGHGDRNPRKGSVGVENGREARGETFWKDIG
jgi:hypothetical protein